MGAARHSRARRRACDCALLGSGPSTGGSACVRRANVGQGKPRAGQDVLQGVRHGGAAAQRRGRSGCTGEQKANMTGENGRVKGHREVLHLFTSRRRRAEGRSGDAEIPRRRHSGSKLGRSVAHGRGRVDGSLSACSGGSDAGSSCKATKRVRMAGTGLTARSIVEELTVGRPGRALMAGRRWARVWGKLGWG